MRAEDLYIRYLSQENNQDHEQRWANAQTLELSPAIAHLTAPAADLRNYTVLGLLDKSLLVMETGTTNHYVIKSIPKSSIIQSKPTIVVPNCPFMVSLHRIFELEHSIVLLLQHASGGPLWKYVKDYLKSDALECFPSNDSRLSLSLSNQSRASTEVEKSLGCDCCYHDETVMDNIDLHYFDDALTLPTASFPGKTYISGASPDAVNVSANNINVEDEEDLPEVGDKHLPEEDLSSDMETAKFSSSVGFANLLGKYRAHSLSSNSSNPQMTSEDSDPHLENRPNDVDFINENSKRIPLFVNTDSANDNDKSLRYNRLSWSFTSNDFNVSNEVSPAILPDQEDVFNEDDAGPQFRDILQRSKGTMDRFSMLSIDSDRRDSRTPEFPSRNVPSDGDSRMNRAISHVSEISTDTMLSVDLSSSNVLNSPASASVNIMTRPTEFRDKLPSTEELVSSSKQLMQRLGEVITPDALDSSMPTFPLSQTGGTDDTTDNGPVLDYLDFHSTHDLENGATPPQSELCQKTEVIKIQLQNSDQHTELQIAQDSAVESDSGFSTNPEDNLTISGDPDSPTGTLNCDVQCEPSETRPLVRLWSVCSDVTSSQLHIPEKIVKQWSAEIVVALEFLHSQGVIWRDLNPSNILLENGHVLLTFCGQFSCVQHSRFRSDTLHYVAPELLRVSAYPLLTSCDWWSFGALVFELLTGNKLTVVHSSNCTIHAEIDFPAFVSPEAKDLVKRLLNPSPFERLGLKSADEIKGHPFYADINWRQLIDGSKNLNAKKWDAQTLDTCTTSAM